MAFASRYLVQRSRAIESMPEDRSKALIRAIGMVVIEGLRNLTVLRPVPAPSSVKVNGVGTGEVDAR